MENVYFVVVVNSNNPNSKGAIHWIYFKYAHCQDKIKQQTNLYEISVQIALKN